MSGSHAAQSGRAPVTAVIADDEALLRAQLKARLGKLWPELAIVHEMADGRDVDRVIEEHAPRLFFLDIHMPGMNGLEAARAIGKRAHVVFVTAFDQYAVEAFEQGAIDYVLKPFNEDRLAATVERLKERLAGAAPPPMEELLERLAGRLSPRPAEHLKWIKASLGQSVRLIPVEEVLFFQSDEKYTRVVTCDAEALIRKPIKELLDELEGVAPSQVEHDGDHIVVRHVYIERRLTPLNMFLERADDWERARVIREYGDAIAQLARSNIFAGDLLYKNFGVTRHGRVIFYDYDEIEYLTDCNFRKIPPPPPGFDDMSSDVWYAVGPRDVFPEEFETFLLTDPRIREDFRRYHACLLDAGWWQDVQREIRNGSVPEVLSYPESVRFGRDASRDAPRSAQT